MTLPRADSDRLMLVASLKRSPVVPLLLCRSLPARSTRLRVPTWICPASYQMAALMHTPWLNRPVCICRSSSGQQGYPDRPKKASDLLCSGCSLFAVDCSGHAIAVGTSGFRKFGLHGILNATCMCTHPALKALVRHHGCWQAQGSRPKSVQNGLCVCRHGEQPAADGYAGKHMH